MALARPIGKLNCRHKIYSIILGISEPNYSEEELQAMKEASLRKTEFDGKEMTTYEATQAQRRLEREIRKQKNRSVLAASAGDDEMRREAQIKINQLTGKYKDLFDAFGLKTKAERMQVSGYRPVKEKKLLSEPRPEPSGFQNKRKLKDHCFRHASDFGIDKKDTEAYLERVISFFKIENDPDIEEVRIMPVGIKNVTPDYYRFNHRTNEFGIMRSDG